MQQMLNDDFGIGSVVVTGLHADLYPKIGTGEVDFITGWWPGNAPFIQGPHVNVSAKVLPISTVYRGAGLFWLVPDYLDPALVSLANLSLPMYANAFVKNVTCFAQGTELPTAALHALDRYQLGVYNFSVTAGIQDDVYAYMKRLYNPDTKQAFLVVSTQPTFFDTDVYRMRTLADPLLAMGSPVGQSGILMASRTSGILDRLPAAAQRALARVSFTIDQVNEIGLQWMQRSNLVTPGQAVSQYLQAHPELKAAWLDDSFDSTLRRLSLPVV
jgi:ABC-type proline/glycine betaine transport system substrate-binding protein